MVVMIMPVMHSVAILSLMFILFGRFHEMAELIICKIESTLDSFDLYVRMSNNFVYATFDLMIVLTRVSWINFIKFIPVYKQSLFELISIVTIFLLTDNCS